MSYAFVFPLIAAGGCTVLALVAAIRARIHRTAGNWILAAGLLFLATESLCSALGAHGATFGAVEAWQQRRLLALSLVPGAWLLFALVYARGNAGQFLASWRLVWVALLLLPVGVAVASYGSLVYALSQNGIPIIRLSTAGLIIYVFVVIGAVLVLLNLERTFRASVGTMRWRIKFMLLGIGLLFLVRLYSASQALLFREVSPRLESLNATALILSAALIGWSFVRSGRSEPDVYPSQSLLQGSLTILLAGVYLVLVGIFAKVTTYFGGDETFPLQAFLVLVSLVVLAGLLQSDRVRLHLRRYISRNFQRPIHDYRVVWQKFTHATGAFVDPGDLCRAVVRMTADIFQSLSVTIWLVNDKKDALTVAASTSVSDSARAGSTIHGAEMLEIVRHFENAPDAIDLDATRASWAEAFRARNPSQFPRGGHRVCVPLMRQGEMTGLIVLGDRVGGIEFSLEDFDLLACIADQTTASLLNVQLSRKLVEAKELEAFQTMAAFFVHDLKNAASTLNLMLKNLPVHFDDPAFREDALRGIAKTVSHIQRLISRLGLLRGELKIQATRGNLNAVVESALAGLDKAAGGSLVKAFAAVPDCALDPEQLQKVVTNLVLNAAESMTDSGEVRVSTSAVDGWAVLTVADQGCGMSPEFMRTSLFRPFQTTKKTGLGIGMFQSRMIVEAHGGRMTVASEVGKGTTFQVYLPTRGKE
jgi:putative PEP-CTERM system histidine kinase